MMGSLAAINLVLALLAEGGPVSALIDKARAEGRQISKTEWDALFANDDAAMSDLDAAIAKAKAEGR
jgi:hypothetical protein